MTGCTFNDVGALKYFSYVIGCETIFIWASMIFYKELKDIEMLIILWNLNLLWLVECSQLIFGITIFSDSFSVLKIHFSWCVCIFEWSCAHKYRCLWRLGLYHHSGCGKAVENNATCLLWAELLFSQRTECTLCPWAKYLSPWLSIFILIVWVVN